MHQLNRFGAVLFAGLTLGACTGNLRLPGDNKTPGTFEVEFRWRGTPPEPSGNLFVFGFVLDCAGVTDAACMDARQQRQLSLSGPQVYDGSPELAFESVPNGTDRVVLMEFREGNTLDAQVLYAGRSGRFTLEPGKHVVVPVEVEILPTPAAPGVTRPTVEVVADVTVNDGSPRGRRYVTDADVAVKVTAENAVRVRISADPTMTNAAVTQTLEYSALAAAPGGGVLVPWNVQQGEMACTVAGGCARRVYVRVLDAQGYASPQVGDEVILDVVDPSVTGTSGPIASVFRAADEVIYVVDFNEPMAVSPAPTLVAARVGAPGDVITFAPPDVSPTGTTFTFRAPGALMTPDGRYTLVATGMDLAHRTLGAHQLAEVVLDGTAPVLSNISLPGVTTPTFARNASFRVRFDVDEALTTAEVAVGGRPASRVSGAGAGTWEFQYVVDATAVEGIQPVTIRVLDAAGNQGAALGPSVLLDFTGPALTFAVVPSGRTARLGEVVAVTVASNETLASGIQLDSGGLTLMGPQGSGTTYVWSGDVPLGVSGTFTISAMGSDTAGNASTAGSAVMVTVDGVPPTAQNLVVDPPRVRAGETFHVRFTASEELTVVPPGTFSNGVETRSLVLVANNGRDYDYQGTAPDLVTVDGGIPDAGNEDAGSGDGGTRPAVGGPYYTVTLTLTDLPGNVSRINTPQPVEIDNVPAAASLQVSPPAARRGDEVRIIVSANEVLARAPRDRVLNVDPPRLVARHRVQTGVELEFVLVAVDTPDEAGISFAYRAVMGASQLDGVYDVLPADVLDVAGNASILDPNGATLDVDVTPPAILSPTGLATALSANPGFNHFSLAFDTSEPAVISVAVGDWDILSRGDGACVSNPAGAVVHHVCTYTVTANDALTTPSGVVAVRITARDGAQNTSFESLSVVLDFEAPQLLAAPIIEPKPAGLYRELTYTVAVNEPLQNNLPVVTLQGAGAPVLDYRVGTQYTFVHVVRSGVTNSGTYQPSVILTDVVGNTVTLTDTSDEGSVVVDAVAPTIGDLMTSRRRVSAVPGFDTYQVTFNRTDDQDLSEAELPTLRVGANIVTCTNPSDSDITCVYTVQPTDTDGGKDVLLTVTDTAGNATFAELDLFIDRRTPVLVNHAVTPSSARIGDVILITAEFDEVPSGTPQLTIGGSAALPVFTPVPATEFVYSHLVTAADATGSYTISVAVTDAVGNAATYAPAGWSFSVDAVAPTVTNVTVNRTLLSRVAGFNTLTVTATVTDDQSVAGVQLTGLGTNPVACTESPPLSGGFTCNYVVTAADSEGLKTASIVARDAAGNLTSVTNNVVLDFTAPRATTGTVTPPLVGVDGTAVFTLVLDEAAVAAPTLILNRTGGAAAQPPVVTAVAGTTYVYTSLIDATTTNGEYNVNFTATDLVGNTATRNGPASFRFNVDSDAPTVTNFTPNATRFSLVPGFDTVVVTFDRGDNVGFTGAVTPTMRVGTHTADCVEAPLDHFTCTYVVTAVNTEGSKNLEVTVWDGAGNETTRTVAVALDFSAPQLVAQGAGPTPAGIGTVVVVNVSLDEDAAGVPSLVLTRSGGAANPPVCAPVNGSRYSWTCPILASTTGGEYDLDVVVTDTVGNSQTRTGPASFKFNVDSNAPSISNLVTNGVVPSVDQPARFSRIPGFNTVNVTFTVSEVIPTAPTMQLGNQAPVACVNAGGNNWGCTHTIPATGGTEGVKDFTITLADPAGNTATAQVVVLFDFSGPRIDGTATRIYLPAAGNPKTLVTGMTLGTSARLLFDTDEQVTGDPVVTTPPTASLTWAKDGAASAGNTYAYATTLSTPPAAQGLMDITVSLVDLVGNPRSIVVSPRIRIDTVAPVAANTAASGVIRYTRIPFGGDGTNGVPEFSLTAQAGGFEGASTAYVFAGPAAGSQLLGTKPVAADGSVAGLVLAPVDLPVVYVAAVDDAGNIGPLSDVKDVSWRVSLGGKVPGRLYPNYSVFTSGVAYPPVLNPVDAAEHGEADGLALRAEGATLTTVGGARWLRLGGWSNPLARALAASAYDARRGVWVVFGGRGGATGTQLLDDTWEWNGHGWTRVVLSDPEGDGNPGIREGAAMAYDAARGTVILFGGLFADTQNRFQGETWEYNGESWRRLSTTGATCRAFHAMAYDEVTRRVVLFGGLVGNASCSGPGNERQDTWAWNGTSWAPVTVATPPPVRQRHAMATFPGTNRIVLVGGLTAGVARNDTWEFTGAGWTQVTGAGTPGARYGTALTAQVGVQGNSPQLLLGGGTDGTTVLADVWRYNGTTWTVVVPTDPEADGNASAREGHVMAWDLARREAVFFGGRNGAVYLDDTWGFDAVSLARRASPDPEADGDPTPRHAAAAAYDTRAVRQRTVVFGGRTFSGACEGNAGGFCGETWEFTGSSWVRAFAADQTGVAAPAPRHSSAAAFDVVANRVFLFGGLTAAGEVNDSWRWSGSAWVKLAPAASPAARHSHAMAYDEARSQAVLFGGRGAVTNCDGSGAFTCNGTWLFDTALGNWVPGGPTTVPTGRRKHAMAYDRDRQRVVMFGGTAENGSILGDTWEWNGTNWLPFTPAQSPLARACHTLSYDRIRQKTVLFGGSVTNSGCNNATDALNDVWEWDGVTWREVASPTVRTSDVEGDSVPVARLAAAAVYDPVRRQHLMVGGLSNGAVQCDGAGGGNACGYAWAFDAGSGDRPAHVYTVPLIGNGEDWDVVAPPTITALRAQWRVGAEGDSGGGVLTSGAALWAWHEGRFVQLDTNNAGPGAPVVFNWDAVNNPTLAGGGYFSGAEHFVTLAVSPRDNAGRLLGRARVLSDYVEITVAYRRP